MGSIKKFLSFSSALLCLALIIIAAGCAAENSAKSVAAKVNGVDISEEKVTTSIEAIRSSQELESEGAWGQWLVNNAETPASMREKVLNTCIEQELIREAANERGLVIDASSIDDLINATKAQYPNEDEWKKSLESIGFDENTYRQNVELSFITARLQEDFIANTNPTDNDLLAETQNNINRYDGLKKYSYIFFDAESKETALDVFTRLNKGELDFESALQQYSKNNESWNFSDSTPKEYSSALVSLGAGDMSSLIVTGSGSYLVKCLEVFTAPETITSLDEIPVEIINRIRENLKNTMGIQAYQAWLNEIKSKADITVYDMPENLPYDIDLAPYTPSNSFDETEENNDDTEEKTVIGEGKDTMSSEEAARESKNN